MKRSIIDILIVLFVALACFCFGFLFGVKYSKDIYFYQNPVTESLEEAEDYQNQFKYENPFEEVETNPFAN